MSAPERTCDDCGLPISICNARAMVGRAVFRHGGAEVAKHMGLPPTISSALALPEVRALVEALRPFAEYMANNGQRLDLKYNGSPVEDDLIVGWVYLMHSQFRAAEAALRAIEGAAE